MLLARLLFILILRCGTVWSQQYNWGPWWSKDLNTSCVFTPQPCGQSNCSLMNSAKIFKTTNCGSWTFVLQRVSFNSPDGSVIIKFPEDTILSVNFDMIADFVTGNGEYPLNTVLLYGLKGIDLDFFAPLRLNDLATYSRPDKLGRTTLSIHDSPFDLYHHGEHISTPDKCNSQTYQALINVKSQANVLQVFMSLSFWYAKFNNKICQYMFQNIAILWFKLEGYSLEFVETSMNGSKLNSSISMLQITRIVNFQLSTKVLDPEVFEKTTYIDLQRVILLSIQADLFKDRFYSLTDFLLDIFNLESFLHSRYGVEWIKYLNYHIKDFDLDDQTSIQSSLDFIRDKAFKLHITFINKNSSIVLNADELFPYLFYGFPDQDFCMFHDFPVQRLVFLQLSKIVNVTCTIAWLYRYMNYYSSFRLENMDSSLTMPKCNFSQLIEQCHLTNRSSFQDDPYITWYEWGRTITDLKMVLIDYTKPIVCVICLTSNILVVLCIEYNYKRRREISSQPKGKDKEIVLLEQSLYKYILLNSILNSIYSLTTLIDYLIPCTPIRNVYYVYPLPEDCKPKAVFFDALASILKLMSNFSFLQISINRFILVGKDHPEWIVKTSQITVKKFFFYSLIVSFILSSSSYFEIDFFSMSPNLDLSDLRFQSYEGYNYIGVEVARKIRGLNLVSWLTIVHDLFSYFLYCLVSLIIDIMTVKKLHNALREKEKVKGKADRRKNRESERRSIIMVVLSSLVNFLLRAPEIISVIFYNLVLNSSGLLIRVFCFMFSDCLSILQFSKVFYILSLSCNLYFYVKFNSVFRLSFMYMIRSIFNCKTKKPAQSKP